MRFLIDGYNLMFAQGLLGQRFGPDRFRKVRTRFLNELAEALGAVDAHLTTVVFDAAAPPEDRPRETTHKGIHVVFAVDEENADERIERLIAEHPAPKSLTVVSSDNRIRQAATRRRARALTADEFLASLDARKTARAGPPAAPNAAEPKRDAPLSPEEADYWLRQFGALETEPGTRDAFANDTGIPTDEEIAEIEREVDREFGAGE
jgi:predicted RNA-binding protein with PIN domain